MKLLKLMLPLALSVASLTANAEVFKSARTTSCYWGNLDTSYSEERVKNEVIASCLAANFSYESCTSAKIHITRFNSPGDGICGRSYEYTTTITAYLQVGKTADQ